MFAIRCQSVGLSFIRKHTLLLVFEKIESSKKLKFNVKKLYHFLKTKTKNHYLLEAAPLFFKPVEKLFGRQIFLHCQIDGVK